MIFTSGIVSVIIQKNKLCKNKIRAIYFCPNCVKFLPENINVFFFFRQTLTKTKQKCKKNLTVFLSYFEGYYGKRKMLYQ